MGDIHANFMIEEDMKKITDKTAKTPIKDIIIDLHLPINTFPRIMLFFLNNNLPWNISATGILTLRKSGYDHHIRSRGYWDISAHMGNFSFGFEIM